MSEVAGSIRRGLEQAVAYAKGEADRRAYRVYVPKRVDVRAIPGHDRRGREVALQP
jgi:putative transcriptional regulator